MATTPTNPPAPAAPSYLTLGPGTLTFGAVGSNIEISDYVKTVKVSPSVNAEDGVLVLSGRTIPGDRTYAYTLSFTSFQTLKKGGLIDWSYKNAGKEVPFEFKPKDKSSAAVVKGTVVVDPIELGGDVGTKPTSDVEYAIVGSPVFTPEA